MVMVIVDEFVWAQTYLGVKSLWFRQLRAFLGLNYDVVPSSFFLVSLKAENQQKQMKGFGDVGAKLLC